MTLIDTPDVDSWRQRLGHLLEGLDLADDQQRGTACEIVTDAAKETSARGLRRLAAALGTPQAEPAPSRGNAVWAVVRAWAALPAAERVAPAVGRDGRADALVNAQDLAAAALRAVGGPGEAQAVERLRAYVEWIASVTPGLGS